MSRSALLKRRDVSPSERMAQYGNQGTFNFETVLRENILRSRYWAETCIELEGWQEIVDEIYYSVEHVEPWMSGNARGPSTAFCLMFRLCQLKPTPAQIRMMLDHKDSPYIRAVGFLYLRYVCNPRELWGWYKGYLNDEEEITPSPGSDGKAITVGEFVRDITLDQYYFETIFPRIPKPVMDEILEDLKAQGLPTAAKGNAGQGGADRRGVDDGRQRPASVKASLSVALGQRAPNRAGAREEGRGLGAGMKGGVGERRRSPSLDRYRDDRRGREPRDRERDERRDERRRSRSPYRSERDDRRREYDDRRRERSPRRDYDRREQERNDDRRGRSRSRDREYRRREEKRSDSGGRGARDVFRDRAGGGSSGADRLRDAYG